MLNSQNMAHDEAQGREKRQCNGVDLSLDINQADEASSQSAMALASALEEDTAAVASESQPRMRMPEKQAGAPDPYNPEATAADPYYPLGDQVGTMPTGWGVSPFEGMWTLDNIPGKRSGTYE